MSCKDIRRPDGEIDKGLLKEKLSENKDLNRTYNVIKKVLPKEKVNEVFVTVVGKNGGNAITLDIDGNHSQYVKDAMKAGYTLNEAILLKIKLFSKSNLDKFDWTENFDYEPTFGANKDNSYASALVNRTVGGKVMSTIIPLDNLDNNSEVLENAEVPKRSNVNKNFNTYAEEKAAIDLIETLVLDVMDAIQYNKAELQIRKDKGEVLTLDEEQTLLYEPRYNQLKDIITADLQAIQNRNSELGNTRQAEFIGRIIEDLNTMSTTDISVDDNGKFNRNTKLDPNSIWLKALNKLSKDYKIVVNKDDLNEDEDGQFLKKLFDKYSADTSVKENIGLRVKKLIRGLAYKVAGEDGAITLYNEFTGTPELVDVNFVINTIQDKTANSLTPQEFKRVLDDWSVNIPYLTELVNALEEDVDNGGDLINAVFYDLHTVRPEILINIIRGKSDVAVDSSGRIANQPPYIKFADKLLTEIKYRILNNNFDEVWHEKVKVIAAKAKGAVDMDTTFKYELELLESIGVVIPDTLKHALYKDKAARKFIPQITSKLKAIANTNVKYKEYNDKVKLAIKEGRPYRELNDVLEVNIGARGGIVYFVQELSRILSKYDVTAAEELFVNADSTNEYALRNASWLDSLFSMINAKDQTAIKDFIRRLDKMGKIKDSNFIRAYDNGSLNMDKAIKDLQEVLLRSYGGNRHSSGKGSKYMDNTDSEWLFDLATFAIDGIREDGSKSGSTTITPGMVMSDSERSVLFRHKHFKIIAGDNLIQDVSGYVKFKDRYNQQSPLTSMYRIINREISEMIMARDTMFDINDDNQYTPKQKTIKDKDGNDIQVDDTAGYVKNYSWNGKTVLSNNGKVTGRVFAFHSITGLQEGLSKVDGLFNSQGIITVPYGFDLNTITSKDDSLAKAVLEKAFDIINESLIAETIEMDKMFNSNKKFIVDKIKTQSDRFRNNKNKTDNTGKYADYRDAQGTIVLTDEQIYKNFISDYALNTSISLSEQQNLMNGSTAFYKDNGDTNKRAKELVSPARILSTYQLDSNVNIAIFKDLPLNSSSIKALAKNIKDAKQEKGLIDSYNNAGFEITDGQGYITPKGYANWLIGHGKSYVLNKFYKVVNGQYVLKPNINSVDMVELLNPIKPFFYDYTYNEDIGIVHPFMIKPSFVLLHDDIIKNTQLQVLRDKMDKEGIEIGVFESAVKVGSFNVNDLDAMNSDEHLQTVSLERAKLGDQVDIINHHMDTYIKAGIQIFKLIDTMADDLMYDETTTLRKHYQNLIGELLDRSNLEMNEIMTEDLSQEELSGLLLDMAGDSINDNMKDLLEIDPTTGEFKRLLELLGNNKWQSLLTSKFTNVITNLKIPGMHNVMVSNYGMESTVSTKDKSMVSASEYGVKNLKMLKDKDSEGRYVFEALVPAWSKDFFDEDGKPIPIENLSEDLRTMIAYRIPTSAPHSAFVIKIVGFLPNDMGSTIVVPDEVLARTGADFDIDTLYINRKTHRPLTSDSFTSQRFEDFKIEDLNTTDLLNGNIYKNYNHKWALFNQYIARLPKDEKDKYYKALSEVRQANNSLNTQRFEASKQLAIQNKDAAAYGQARIDYHVKNNGLHSTLRDLDSRINDMKNEFDKLNKQGVFDINAKAKFEALVEQHKTVKVNIEKLRKEWNDVMQANKELATNGKLDLTKKELDALIDSRILENSKFLDVTLNPIKEKFVNDLTVYQQHNNDTLYSEIVDTFDKFLNNPELLYRNNKPAEFRSIRDISVEAETAENLNPNLFSSQFKFRRRNRVGKKTISIFANTNTGISEMAKLNARLTSPLEVVVSKKYLRKVLGVTNDTDMKRILTKRYGSYELIGSNVVIKYTRIGTTFDKSDINIYGEPILDSYGAFIDNAADTVKDRLPNGLTENNINIVNAIGITGDIPYAVRLINQYASILYDAAIDYNKSQLSNGSITPKLQTESAIVNNMLIDAKVSEHSAYYLKANKDLIEELQNNGYDSNINNWTSSDFTDLNNLANNKNKENYNNTVGSVMAIMQTEGVSSDMSKWTIDNFKTLNDRLKTGGSDITIYPSGTSLINSINTIGHMYNYGTIDTLIKNYGTNKLIVEDIIPDAKLRKIALKSFDRHVSNDKSVVLYSNDIIKEVKRSTSNNTENYNNLTHEALIKNTETYKKLTELDNKSRNEFYGGQLALVEVLDRYNSQGNGMSNVIQMLNFDKKGAGKSFYENRNLYKSVQDHISSIRKSPNSITVVTENNEDLIDAIYGTTVEESINPVLYKYYEYGNKNSYEVLSSIANNQNVFNFTVYNDDFNNVIDALIKAFNIKSPVVIGSMINNTVKIMNYNHIINNAGSDFYKLDNTAINNLLGINKPFKEFKEMPPIDEFKDLSLSQQIKLLQDSNNDKFDNFKTTKYDEHHIMSYLTPELDLYVVKSKGFHYITVNDISNEFNLTTEVQESYMQMLQGNEYEQAAAENMLLYNVHRFGLQSGDGSFGYAMPIGMLDKAKLNISNNTLPTIQSLPPTELIQASDLMRNDMLQNILLNSFKFIPSFIYDKTLDEIKTGAGADVFKIKDNGNKFIKAILKLKDNETVVMTDDLNIARRYAGGAVASDAEVISLINPINNTQSLLIKETTENLDETVTITYTKHDIQPNSIDLRNEIGVQNKTFSTILQGQSLDDINDNSDITSCNA